MSTVRLLCTTTLAYAIAGSRSLRRKLLQGRLWRQSQALLRRQLGQSEFVDSPPETDSIHRLTASTATGGDSENADPNANKLKVPAGIIVGICLGVAAGVFAAVFGLFYLFYVRPRRASSESGRPWTSPPPVPFDYASARRLSSDSLPVYSDIRAHGSSVAPQSQDMTQSGRRIPQEDLDEILQFVAQRIDPTAGPETSMDPPSYNGKDRTVVV